MGGLSGFVAEVVVGSWVERVWLVGGLTGCAGEGMVSSWVDRVWWGGCG